MEQIEQKTGIDAERVSKLSCAGCQKVLDVSHLPSFVNIKCPECGMEQIVPAKFGSFLLIKQIGAGGMGVIYRAMDRDLGRKVALKVMKKSLGDDPEFAKAFKHEAQAAAALNHRNVVQIYSIGQYNGQPYIAMELVDGGKLDDMIADGPMDELKALAIHIEVTEGLKAASDFGLVHGDVKPANILFSKSGEAKVLDFGLASYVGEQQKAGAVWGTPYYIAPEKARGKKADFRSDIYSLGATLFHVLTSKPPFDGPTSNDVVMARLNQPAPDILTFNSNLHPETAKMVARMLEMDPAMRYPSYPALLVDMQAALNAARKPLGKSLRPPTVPITVVKPAVKFNSLFKWINLKIAAIVAGAVVLIALISAGAVIYTRHQAHLKQEAENRRLLEQSVAAGRETWGRIVNLMTVINEQGTNIAPIAQRADKIAVSISRIDAPTATIMDAMDMAAEWLNESEDLLADAFNYQVQLNAATNAQAAGSVNAKIEAAFNRIITIQISIQEAIGLARETFKEAGTLQSKALEEINKARAEKARREAELRKAEADKKLALRKKAQLEKMRPQIMQNELDIIERNRGANNQLVSRRRYGEAALSFAPIKSQLTLDETRAVYANVMETYTEIEKFYNWLLNSINRTPCKNCFAMGESSHDIVKADSEDGLTVSLGPAGTTKIKWQAVSVAQVLKMANYYVEATNLDSARKAAIFKQMALYCYENGVFKTAETYASAAAKANPDLLPDLNRLMPEMASSE